MAATDKTRIAKPSPIKEDEQGQLVAKKGISREVIEELSKVKGEPAGCARSASSRSRSSSASRSDLGRRPVRPRPLGVGALLAARGWPLRLLGRRPRGAERDLREARHSPGRARAPGRSRGRMAAGALLRGAQAGVRRQGDHLLRDGHGGPGARGPGPRVLHEEVRAAAGQQVLGAARGRLVRRLVPLRPQGREGRPRYRPTSAWRARARARSSTR